MSENQGEFDKMRSDTALMTLLKRPSQEQIVLLITVAILLTFSILLDGFASISNLITLTRSVSVLGILGVGMAVVVISRGLDLSQIATMAACSAWVLKLISGGMPIIYAILLGFIMAVIIGVINGVLIAYMEMPALFVTLAMGFLITGIIQTGPLGGDFILRLPKGAEAFMVIGQGVIAGIPIPIFLFALIAFSVHLFLSKTSYGRFIYAHGDNAETARLTGIAVRPLTVMEYVLSAVIGYIGGLIMASAVAQVDLRIIKSSLIFDSILVVVLGGISLSGGRGSILSVIVGTALIGTLLNGMTIMNLSGETQNIVKGLVLLGAILLDNYLHPIDEEVERQGDL